MDTASILPTYDWVGDRVVCTHWCAKCGCQAFEHSFMDCEITEAQLKTILCEDCEHASD